ncbi:MAG TPA: hypothetical protein VGI76_08490 [Solirubrobacteraceae bacterium]|jgi:hypothetical protein
MALHHQLHYSGRAPVPPSAAVEHPETVSTPSPGAYLTDETALFRVADIHTHGREMLLELEDCVTLELILYPARKLGGGCKLRVVTPASTRASRSPPGASARGADARERTHLTG